MSTHGLSTRSGDATPAGEFGLTGKYGRLFPEAPPLNVTDPRALVDLGKAMNEDVPGVVTGDHPSLPAGYTYLGQFIDHDITFDPTSLREVQVDPLALRNFRTPALDLDSLYGGGPSVQPMFYQRQNNALFMPGTTSPNRGTNDPGVLPSQVHDLPRTAHGFAVIADPRNDENLIVAQLHLAFLLFHNQVVSGLEGGSIPRRLPGERVFDEARQLVTWHYQWLVLEDFLPAVIDPNELNQVRARGSMLSRLAAARGSGAFIPVEFSAAAYRFGHSLVNSSYDYNRVFNHATGKPAALADLFDLTGRRGGRAKVPIPSDWIIDWRRFFALDRTLAPGKSRLIDPYLSLGLKEIAMGAGINPLNLAVQNLKRGNSLGLPSGQSIATSLRYDALDAADIAGSGPDGAVAANYELHKETPLWYYVLKEAQLKTRGVRLGPVGSRILAEVFVGLLEGDPSSFLSCEPDWKPSLGGHPGSFTFADLLQFVGDVNPVG